MTRLHLLDLRGTRVEDISSLTALKVEFLILTSTPAIDLSPLARMKSLVYLDLWGTTLVSDKAMKELQIALPKCQIRQIDSLTKVPVMNEEIEPLPNGSELDRLEWKGIKCQEATRIVAA